ncbi:MAG: glycosyl hydrolase family 28-related protein [Rikenellaceae bacterium]
MIRRFITLLLVIALTSCDDYITEAESQLGDDSTTEELTPDEEEEEEENSDSDSSGDGSTGDGSTGDGSTGDGSTGDGSTGDDGSGDDGSGDDGSGENPFGDGSTGDGGTTGGGDGIEGEDNEEEEEEDKDEDIYVTTFDKNLATDYGIYPSTTADATAALQAAFDELSEAGGGSIYFPAGTYLIDNLCMRSNIHLYLDPGVLLMSSLSVADGRSTLLHFSYSKSSQNENFIENCSIQCAVVGQKYKVSFAGRNTAAIAAAQSVLQEYSTDMPDWNNSRFIVMRMVRNFVVADADITDEWMENCPLLCSPFNPSNAQITAGTYGDEVWDWEVSRPTNGVIKSCTARQILMGYALVQLYGAKDLHFEDLESHGGITLRMESGSSTPYQWVGGITGENIRNYDGMAAFMANPHTVRNGTFDVNNIYSYGSTFAVLLRKGFLDSKADENDVKGTYEAGSKLSNIYATFGTNAQVDDKIVYLCHTSYTVGEDGNYSATRLDENFRLSWENGCRNTLVGPSAMAVLYESVDVERLNSPIADNGEYVVEFEGEIASTGFPEGNDQPIYYEDGIDPATMQKTAGIDISLAWSTTLAVKAANGVQNVPTNNYYTGFGDYVSTEVYGIY